MTASVLNATATEPAQPLVEELPPTLDPWDAAQRLAGCDHLLYFDSAASDPHLGRYSFITADPFERLSSRQSRIDPFAVLAQRLKQHRVDTVPGLPPFQGGAAGLFAYDLCHHLERLPRPRFDDFQFPDLVVGLYDWVLAFDHLAGRAWLISTGLPETDPRRRRRRAARRLRAVQRWLRNPPSLQPETSPVLSQKQLCPQYGVAGRAALTSNFDRSGYLAAARRAIDYIHAGDCFQVNLAQRLLMPAGAALPPLALYGRLRQRNPAPFGALFYVRGELAIASASPERFLKVENRVVEARPIKGTRPRGPDENADEDRRRELLASAKDRAENVMIVDLLRNDLGRVCAYGSVEVPAVCQIESHPYVHHLVSVVRGRLRNGAGPVDLLRAAFPGGSVTGAPKIRAMEIIAELEPSARGPYCGCLGYLGFDGSMDTSILIRTFTISRGWVQFPVGGGIVADSNPEREYEETWHKAEGLLRALD
jgi:para-aminobenzoate synthetase component 1